MHRTFVTKVISETEEAHRRMPCNEIRYRVEGWEQTLRVGVVRAGARDFGAGVAGDGDGASG